MNTASLNIRNLRKKHRLTQEQMAQKLGIKRSLLGAYEEARANPRLEVLVKAAELFNVSVDQLVSDTLKTPPIYSKSMKEYQHDNRPHRAGDDVYKGLDRYQDEVSSTSSHQTPERPYLPPRKINLPSSDTKKTLQRLRLVHAKAFKQYFFNAPDQEYLESLPELILPLPSSIHAEYRAFELTEDAMQSISGGTIVVGRKIDDIQHIKNGKAHLLITREGIFFRRVFNHIQRSGELVLEATHKAYKRMVLSVMGKEIEAWEAVLYIADEASYPFLSLQNEQDREVASLTSRVDELQKELMHLKRKVDNLL